ncbi:ornithine cyclodeaminase family protein [Pseudonocardia sp. DSM 110487]|uniref:ornithine cyclodeaminase family protein n=1 Tax=Pseudonocardia sp. DSM 110487 TaxID=2865833 RepID=UPI001C69CA63|nr:ornithine cyclodeaminase family protein [Pseudonocardia sp. DSM 110487]QYN33511.1 ornithine cyclodeaminase family protein [Pseudonocardia sp. DSM 110487]
MTVFLSDADVRSVFDWPLAISALREAYAQEADEKRYPARTMARGGSAWLRTLSGVAADTDLMGAKLIAVSLSSRRTSYLIPLFDQRSAELVALLDGHSVTGYRTAATSALAADLLAVDGLLEVAVIGSGFEARNHVRALVAVRDLKAVRVFSPRAESRARFVDELADLPVAVVPAESAEAALLGASLVICAARSRDESPTLHGAWLRPGITVVSIGSTLPEQREVDTDVLDRADVIVADMVEEVLEDTGDLIAARAVGIDPVGKTTSLSDVVSGRHPGRTSPDQVVLYKSVGAALQDLAVASRCAQVAEQRGVGIQLPVSIQPVQK